MTVLVEDSLRLLAGRGILWITDRPEAHAGLPAPDDLKNDSRVRRMNVHLQAVLSAAEAEKPEAWRGINGVVLDFNDGGFSGRSSIAAVQRLVKLAASHKARVVILDHVPALGGEQFDGPMWRPIDASQTAIPVRYGLSLGEALKLFSAELATDADLHVVPARGVRRRDFITGHSKLPWSSPIAEVKDLDDAVLASAVLPLEGTALSVGRGTDAPLVRIGAPWLDPKKVIDALSDRPLPGVKFETDRFTPRRPSDGKYDGQSIPAVRIRVLDRTRIQTGRLALDLAWAVWSVHKDSLKLGSAGQFPGLGAALALVARGADPDSLVDVSMPDVVAFQKRARAVMMYR